MGSLGTSGLIPLNGGNMAGAQPAIVTAAPAAKGAKPEEIYRAWLELAEQRIGAEQTLLNGYTLQADDQKSPGERDVLAVLRFFDTLAPQVFTRQTDVGELSNYLAGDARRWRELMRALRQRSAGARAAPRYHELTRALAAAEFLASEPIADGEREVFALTDIGADADDSGRTIEVSANFEVRRAALESAPNIAVCLRDANGDVCGEAVFAPPAPTSAKGSALFTATLAASRDVANVEVSLTRRAVG